MYSPSWWNWLPHLQKHKFWEIDFKDLRCYCPKVRKNLFNFPDVVTVVKHVAYVWNFTYLCFKDCSTRFSRQNNRLFIRELNMAAFITKNTKKLSTKNFCWWIPYWKKNFISQIWCTTVHKLREPLKNVKEQLLNLREIPQNGEFVDNNLFIFTL